MATSLDDSASFLNSLSEANTQDWSSFMPTFLKHFDSVTAHYKAQVEAQNAQLDTHESVSIHACRVEDIVYRGLSE